MKFLDLFAGVGGFRRGLELAGHECVGFCEWDKFAAASYTSMHLITDEQRSRLATMDLKKRQKEILKEEYRNGEWYSADVRLITADNIPRADCWCFGAPCQDFSVAGLRKGLDGDRSSLVREVFRVLGELKEEDRPEWLIYENVKGMLSSNRGADFGAIILEMGELGYDIEWELFNSKNFGVPQNRERVYTIGHLRSRGRHQILPLKGADREDSVSVEIIGHRNGYRRNTQVFAPEGATEALSTCQGGGREHHTIVPVMFGIDKNVQGSETECANALTAREDRGVSNFKQTGTAIAITMGYDRGLREITAGAFPTCNARDYKGVNFRDLGGVAIPVLTPDRAEKRQNGRRFKDNGEDMFTLTSQDRHGVGVSIPIREAVSKGYTEAKEGDSINLTMPDSKTRRGRVGKKQAQTLDCGCNQGIIVKLNDNDTVYAVWYEKYQCYIAIRKLTPRECFRLQGWTDDYFEKAAFVNSDSQLYKQAGNGVTVNVVQAIGEAIKED
jgi:DNA (cytosine-5)-methyltransferase 1